MKPTPHQIIMGSVANGKPITEDEAWAIEGRLRERGYEIKDIAPSSIPEENKKD